MADETAPGLRAIEAWARDKGHLIDEKRGEFSHWFIAAKFAARWGAGREVSESDFDAAIAHVQGIEVR
jgi:hypothetical protein